MSAKAVRYVRYVLWAGLVISGGVLGVLQTTTWVLITLTFSAALTLSYGRAS